MNFLKIITVLLVLCFNVNAFVYNECKIITGKNRWYNIGRTEKDGLECMIRECVFELMSCMKNDNDVLYREICSEIEEKKNEDVIEKECSEEEAAIRLLRKKRLINIVYVFFLDKAFLKDIEVKNKGFNMSDNLIEIRKDWEEFSSAQGRTKCERRNRNNVVDLKNRDEMHERLGELLEGIAFRHMHLILSIFLKEILKMEKELKVTDENCHAIDGVLFDKKVLLIDILYMVFADVETYQKEYNVYNDCNEYNEYNVFYKIRYDVKNKKDILSIEIKKKRGEDEDVYTFKYVI